MGSTKSGSSPLARGTPETGCSERLFAGLIPARAGNTRGIPPGTWKARAHPRSRGEHMRLSVRLFTRLGSSPLARGTPARAVKMLTTPGLIPARAGNTVCFLCQSFKLGAHPRSRGEHWGSCAVNGGQRGSSPLARGTLIRLVHPPYGGGLIPARAGNTERGDKKAGRYGAHPRSRGEHFECWYRYRRVAGSSPLARGTPEPHAQRRRAPGLIPARAGNTTLY